MINHRTTAHEKAVAQVIARVQEKLREKYPGGGSEHAEIYGVDWRATLNNLNLAHYSQQELEKVAQKTVNYILYYHKHGVTLNSGDKNYSNPGNKGRE